MKNLILAGLLGAWAIGGVAVAQEQAPLPSSQEGMAPMHHGPGARHGAGMLPQPDANGVITRAAMLAHVDQRFAALDSDHDGKISAEERHAGMEKLRARMTAEPGAQAARRPEETLADARQRASKRFDRLDTNHDGKLDQGEIDVVRQRMMAMRDRMRGQMGRDITPPPPPANAPLPPPGS